MTASPIQPFPAAKALFLTEQPPAMLLAAGRGERMRPLTDTCPKPLLQVQGRPLLQHHLQALAQAGVRRAVVNTGWLGEQIPARFGARFAPDTGGEPLHLAYSPEPEQALETAGGIARALPLLDTVFWLAAGDVYAPDFDFPFEAAREFAASGRLAHLWLVPNPEHHPRGDFGVDELGLACDWPEGDARPRQTYGTIALLRAELFAAPWCDIPPGNPDGWRVPLVAPLRPAMAAGQVSASLYAGRWTDVGTPERLQRLNTPAA